MRLGIGVLVGFVHRQALAAALPILLLWAGSKLISLWLDRPFRSVRNTPSRRDRQFLRRLALRTWRYFAEFSTEEHNWLVPDNVQEQSLKIAPRISPTNLAFLLNARQVACRNGLSYGSGVCLGDPQDARNHGSHANLSRASAELVRHQDLVPFGSRASSLRWIAGTLLRRSLP